MRALTVRQPWALHIMQSGKDVENRSRNIAGSYRGPIAIHASLESDEEALRRLPMRPPNGIPRVFWTGVILGVVDLVDVHHSAASHTSSMPGEPVCFVDGPPIGSLCSEWAQFVPTGVYHLVLADPQPLPTPIPVRGRLGLWTLPDDVAAQVEEALR